MKANLRSPSLLTLLALVAVLLFVGAVRVQHVVDFLDWPDEIWSLWHVRGSLEQALMRVPYDWPPLFSLVAWIWTQLVGPSLEASRYLMVLFALLGAAFVFRAARALFGQVLEDDQSLVGAWSALLVFAGAGYAVFTGVEVRAYGQLLMLGALAVWLTFRWLRRPELWRHTAFLAATLALAFYSSYTSALFVAFLTALVLVLKPRLIVRWLFVLLSFGLLCLPIIPQFLTNAGGRIDRSFITPPPFTEAMVGMFRLYGGHPLFLLILAVSVVVVLIGLFRFAPSRRLSLVLLFWMLVPAVVYVVLESREFITPRYLWWVMIGAALFIGLAFSLLPRLFRPGLVILVILPLLPIDFTQYRIDVTSAPPMRMVLSWFARHIRPDDVLIIDPYCVCGVPIAWDYFLPQYFPEGRLPLVREPGSNSRVWYLATTGWKQDEELLAKITRGRKASIFVGPWNFLLRLYEGPPLWDGLSFGDSVRFNGMEIEGNRDTFAEGDSVRVRLWWSAQKAVEADYSVSLAVLDESGNLVTQADGPPRAPDTPDQMTAWRPGTYYEDSRTLVLPDSMEYATYRLVLAVYDWRTGERLKPVAQDLFEVDGDYLVLRTFGVVAY